MWDGMGNDCTGIYNLLKNELIESFIITRRNKSEKKETHIFDPSHAPVSSLDDIHILHYGGAGYPLENFRKKPGKKILRFHNMTPPEFFKGCNPGAYLSMLKFFHLSILELASLEGEIEICMSDSLFNSETLNQIADIESISIPVILPYKLPRKESNPSLKNNWKQSPTIRICYISRFVPNKKIEDLLKLLYFLKKIYKDSNLVLIGSVISGIEDYFYYLLRIVKELDLEDSVYFLQNVTEEEKKKVLKDSDFFVSMSEHEGFGIPVLEAMQEGVPVLAYDSSALRETMNEGGIVFTDKNFPEIAELLVYLWENKELLLPILDTQYKAMEYYVNFPFKQKVLKAICNLDFQR